jgi:hypothetical protein
MLSAKAKAKNTIGSLRMPSEFLVEIRVSK